MLPLTLKNAIKIDKPIADSAPATSRIKKENSWPDILSKTIE